MIGRGEKRDRWLGRGMGKGDGESEEGRASGGARALNGVLGCILHERRIRERLHGEEFGQ